MCQALCQVLEPPNPQSKAQKSTQGPFQRGGEPSPLCCDGSHQNVQDQVLPGSEQPSLLSALSRRANQAQDVRRSLALMNGANVMGPHVPSVPSPLP